MAANTSPIYPSVGKIGWGILTAANTATDGTGTVATVFTADATDGSRVDRVRFTPLGTNVTTVIRLFLNNGSTNATGTNNALLKEFTLPATTASNAAALVDLEWDADLVLPPGYKINAAMGTAVSAGWQITAIGGDY